MSADLLRIATLARISLPGSIDPVTVAEYHYAMDQFFQGTNIWTTEIEIQITSAVIAAIQAAEATNDPIQIEMAKTFVLTLPNLQTSDTPPVTYTGNIYQLMGLRNSMGDPVDATMGVIPDLILRHSPTTVDTFVATVAVTVDDVTQGDAFSPCFPDWIASKYGNVILAGILGRMMLHPAKPYSNPQSAAQNGRFFGSEVAKIRVEAQRKNLYNAQAWKFPRAFQSRRRGIFW